MIVSYDGTDFCGWQKQNHGPLKSVAHTIEDALVHIFKEPIKLFGSGRTDAGVHATGQVTHFETSRPEKAFEKWDLAWALKPHLPKSICIKQVFLAPPEFHATISATHKTYQYYVYNHQRRPAFLSRYTGWVRKPLRLDHLNASTGYIIGKHDFKSFQSVGTPVPHTVREIYKAEWTQLKPHLFRFTITGSGFLKQMVRNIVGTSLLLDRKDLPPEEMLKILKALDRTQAGAPAEPEGLFLRKVYYPQTLDKQCREL